MIKTESCSVLNCLETLIVFFNPILVPSQDLLCTVSRLPVLSQYFLLVSQDPCPKTSAPRPLSQDHYPKGTVPRPLSQDHYPKASVPRPLSQDHCPKASVPRPLSQG